MRDEDKYVVHEFATRIKNANSEHEDETDDAR
jgi:hypothetical protein